MKVNVNDFMPNLKILRFIVEKNSKKNRIKIATEFSSETGVPVIVSTYYMGLLEGFTDDILNQINKYIKFYGITELEGIDDEFRNKLRQAKERNS